MRERVKISFRGLGNPISKRIIDDLNSICDGIRLDLVLLGTIAKDLEGFKDISKLTTEGGHPCWVLNFETSLGKVAVAFPLNNNLSIAAYADGEFRRGPQSYGEFDADIDAILGAIKEVLLKLE